MSSLSEHLPVYFPPQRVAADLDTHGWFPVGGAKQKDLKPDEINSIALGEPQLECYAQALSWCVFVQSCATVCVACWWHLSNGQLQVLLMLDARDRGKSTEIEGRKQSERRKKVKRRKRKQVTERK